MTDEMQHGIWYVEMGKDDSSAFVKDLAKNIIANIRASSEKKALVRAGLIASAPALLDATIGALEVFRVIADHAESPSNLAARDMIPVLESTLMAANMLGRITDELLEGP